MKRSILFYKKDRALNKEVLKWRETEKVKDPPPGPREYDAPSVAPISPLVFNLKKFTERVLIAAYISPVPSSPPYPLKKDGKSISFLLSEIHTQKRR